MKKIIVIALLTIANSVIAQKSKLVQEVKAGFIVSDVASTSFNSKNEPFALGQNLFGLVSLSTKRAFHNFFYGFGNNSFNTLNGYSLKKDRDVYVAYSRNLTNQGNYLGAGIEKLEKFGRAKFFGFCELGTGFKSKPIILSLGLLMNVSWKVGK